MKSPAFRLAIVTFMFIGAGCATPTCILSTRNAIPAYRLPPEFRTCSRQGLIPIDLNLLGQERPKDGHRLSQGDLVSVFVGGVMPVKFDEQAVIIPPLNMQGNVYYPPYGRLNSPALGVPVDIRKDGSIRLPLVGKLDVEGKTLDKATDIIRLAYEELGVIQKERERVMITLIRPRVHRVVILRDDAQSPMPTFVPKTAVPFTKIGHGEIVDLPAYENDVLHALAQSGGLPGIDVFSEVWVFRNRDVDKNSIDAIQQEIKLSESPKHFAKNWVQKERQVVRIPLRVDPNEPLPFTDEDCILEDGDVVYLPPREVEYFYTGGQLPGGKVPLPRDHDIDVIEAVALVDGSVAGPGNYYASFRTGPGSVYPPTQVLIVRELPNGQNLRIRVDLNRALNNPMERVLIQPDDQLFLLYKPSEMYANLVLNFIGVGVSATFLPKN